MDAESPKPSPSAERALSVLPDVFTYSEALSAQLTEHRVRRLVSEGILERVGNGIYRKADALSADEDLALIAAASAEATLCLLSALAHHDLTDRIPSQFDVALPRSRRPPRLRAPVLWHRFADDTFSVGREMLALEGGRAIGLYSPARTLVDVFRLRHREGTDLAHEALKRWLRRPGAQPVELLSLAHRFPKSERAIRVALEILL